MPTITMTLDEWRAFEAALIEARSFAVDLAPEHPAWDADPPPELDEHAVWRWRFDQVKASLAGVEPAEPAPPPEPPKPSNAKDVAAGILAGLRR